MPVAKWPPPPSKAPTLVLLFQPPGRWAGSVGSGAAAVVAARGWGEAVDALPRARDVRRLPPELAGLPLRPIYGRAPDARPIEMGPPDTKRPA